MEEVGLKGSLSRDDSILNENSMKTHETSILKTKITLMNKLGRTAKTTQVHRIWNSIWNFKEGVDIKFGSVRRFGVSPRAISVYFDAISHSWKISKSKNAISNIITTWDTLLRVKYPIEINCCTSYIEALIRIGYPDLAVDFLLNYNSSLPMPNEKFIRNFIGMLLKRIDTNPDIKRLMDKTIEHVKLRYPILFVNVFDNNRAMIINE